MWIDVCECVCVSVCVRPLGESRWLTTGDESLRPRESELPQIETAGVSSWRYTYDLGGQDGPRV